MPERWQYEPDWVYYVLLMDSMALFTMGTGGHYITMLPADWSISTSHDPLPSSCHSEKMLWNPSISQVIKICPRGSHIDVVCRSFCDRIKMESSDQRSF